MATSGLSASVSAELTSATYIKLAISLCVPIILYVFLLVVTRNMR